MKILQFQHLSALEFNEFAQNELYKCQRYKRLWKNAVNDKVRERSFFAWCIKSFQLQQIHIYSKGVLSPYNEYSTCEAVGYF